MNPETPGAQNDNPTVVTDIAQVVQPPVAQELPKPQPQPGDAVRKSFAGLNMADHVTQYVKSIYPMNAVPFPVIQAINSLSQQQVTIDRLVNEIASAIDQEPPKPQAIIL